MRRFGIGSFRRAGSFGAVTLIVVGASLVGAAPASAIDPPAIDPGALPPDGPPGPDQPMRQGGYCTRVAVLPGTDFRVQPKYMDMLDLPAAWQFGRGAGVKVAVIDTGVEPHPRLLNLTGGGDYIMAGGDGLSDCDAHGTIVASLIAAAPVDGTTILPPPRQVRGPEPVPTTEAPPPPPPPVPPQTVTVQVGPPPPPPPPGDNGGGAGYHGGGAVVAGVYTGGAGVAAVDNPVIPGPPGPVVPGPAGPMAAPGPPGPPAPVPLPADGFSGVAPDVELISIRQASIAFSPKDALFGGEDPQTRQKAGDIRTMARAIVHAANMGAQVINISEVSCMSALNMIDQRELGAAIRYAAIDRNAVIVAAAGNTSNADCKQNPIYDPLQPNDPRDWHGVTTVVTPAWFSDYVLTVGAVDSTGAPMTQMSMAGPWVSIAAPGTDIVGLSPRDDGLINAVEGPQNQMLSPQGTSFSAAIVSGVAALVRAKYPQLSSHQVINRLIQTARAPARGVDNQIGYGIVDPVAALTYDVPAGDRLPPEQLSSPLTLPPPPVGRNMTPVWVAAAGLGTAALVAALVLGVAALMRPREGRR
jgi:membrane-anchored mycosin MYCP